MAFVEACRAWIGAGGLPCPVSIRFEGEGEVWMRRLMPCEPVPAFVLFARLGYRVVFGVNVLWVFGLGLARNDLGRRWLF